MHPPIIIRFNAPKEISLLALDEYCIKMRAVSALDPSSELDSSTMDDFCARKRKEGGIKDPRRRYRSIKRTHACKS